MQRDIRTMDARELGRGLMRGNAREFKQGYSADAALDAITTTRELDPEERLELETYLRGYALGMKSGEDAGELARAYAEGATAGAAEDKGAILPAEGAE